MTFARVLVIDDSAVDRELVRRVLGSGFQVDEAATAQDGLQRLAADLPDCVLLDNRLPDRDGVALLGQLVPQVPVILLTGYGSEAVAVDAMRGGAVDYLVKAGLDRASLRGSVNHAIARFRLAREVQDKQIQLAARTLELETALDALRDREARLRVLLEQLPAVIWTTDRALVVQSVAGRAAGAVGGEHVVGRHVRGMFSRVDVDPEVAHQRALDSEPTSYRATRLGAVFECHVEPLHAQSGQVAGTVGVALDVTAQRRLEEQLLHAQKMEAIGRLAGGVAHDFNNVLTTIVSVGTLAIDDLPPDAPARSDLQQIIDSAWRAEALTRQLLAFSRKRPVRPRVLDVSSTVQQLMRMGSRLVGEGVTIETRLAPVGAVSIDPSALEQVLLNLLVNARDAMPEGGRVILATREVRRDAAAGRPAGRFVEISLRDHGAGMTPEVLELAFEPFFTTKPEGRGTGLGLSTCYGIVQQAGGFIEVESAPGAGSCFRVYLPSVAASAEVVETAGAVRAVERNVGRVLVVEDEGALRRAVVRILVAAGFEVSEAADADEARRVLAREGAHIRLILTDVVMPGETGVSLLEGAAAMGHDVRGLLMSGYSAETAPGARLEQIGAELLEKPFTPAQLVEAVRRALR